jgi:hypothetical protein
VVGHLAVSPDQEKGAVEERENGQPAERDPMVLDRPRHSRPERAVAAIERRVQQHGDRHHGNERRRLGPNGQCDDDRPEDEKLR